MSKKMSKGKIALIIWVIFSILYVGYMELGRFNFVRSQALQQGFEAGVLDSVNKIMQQAPSCQPIPVNAGEQVVELIPTACLTAPEGGAMEK